MGLANEYSLQCEERGERFDYEMEYLARYPGLCTACGGRVCVCPTVPPATVGRMAKEMLISIPPISDADAFDAAGRDVSQKVLESVGRVPGLAKHLPYDRGDMNASLTQLAFRLAHALADNHKDTADRLLTLAVDLGREKRASGTVAQSVTADVIDLLKEAWVKVDPTIQNTIESEQPTLSTLTHMLDIRILIIAANPKGDNDGAIRIDKEISAIRERIRMGRRRDRIYVETITAATVDIIRLELVTNNYDIIHFAGHADASGLELLSEEGTHNLTFDSLGRMLANQKELKCVVLNACSAM